MRMLFLDIETSPFIGYSWGKYEQNILKFVQDSQIICFAWKWLDDSKTYVMALPDYAGYKKGKLDDKKLIKDLWDVLDKAEIVVAHNGDRFDVKMANARFIYHGLTPPSPYATIDTKKIAKAAAMFPSNKLGDLGPYLHEGEKGETGGFDLWLGCLAGDTEAWDKMKKYNKQDVVLLERVYLKLRPWAKTHPNLNVFEDTHMDCTKCGSSHVVKKGFRRSLTGFRHAFQCKTCGGWSSGPLIKSDVLLR